jgi:hypothetical protein
VNAWLNHKTKLALFCQISSLSNIRVETYVSKGIAVTLIQMLVFLDIDGVMVPAKGHKQPEFLADGFAAFSSKSSHVLDRIISEYDATIMLTTSHKSSYTIDEWKTLFKKRDSHTEKIRSLQPNIDHLSRKQEIESWFHFNTAEDFVIIDDDKSLNALPDYLKEHLILTSSYVGLTEGHLEDIKRIVKKNGRVSY